MDIYRSPDLMTDEDAWRALFPNRKDIVRTFSHIVKGGPAHQVITVEAEFGQGKTLFSKAWKYFLETNDNEAVIRFNAWSSDHADDPLLSFAGAVLSNFPIETTPPDVREKAIKLTKTVGRIAGKAALSWLIRDAAGDLQEVLNENLGDTELAGLIEDVNTALSKSAIAALAAQIDAEKIRQNDIPEQIKALRTAITKDRGGSQRLIIMIDELDRCRPDYAIRLLESIKHLFLIEEVIFILFVNLKQIERTATQLFGEISDGERYITKFIDLRLSLPLVEEDKARFVFQYAQACINMFPHLFTEDDKTIFINTATTCALNSIVSLRTIRGIMLNVDLALRCVDKQPIDPPFILAETWKKNCPNESLQQTGLWIPQKTPIRTLKFEEGFWHQQVKILKDGGMMMVNEDFRRKKMNFEAAILRSLDFDTDRLTAQTNITLALKDFNDHVNYQIKLIEGLADITFENLSAGN